MEIIMDVKLVNNKKIQDLFESIRNLNLLSLSLWMFNYNDIELFK